MTSVRAYARLIGILALVSLVAGGFGEAFVPSQILVSGDATATAHNIAASGSLFRLGFAGYLIEAVCDIALTALLFLLLRPVRQEWRSPRSAFASWRPQCSQGPRSSTPGRCSSWAAPTT